MTSEEILQIFFAECDESLAAAEAGLAACKAGTQDADTINAVFRAIHSIKGGAGAFGFGALQGYTHAFETLLCEVREGNVPLSGQLIDLLLRALDLLSDHVTAARDDASPPDDANLIAELVAAQAGDLSAQQPEEPDAASLDDMLDDLMDLMGEAAPSPESSDARDGAWLLHLRPRASAMRNGGEPLLLLRELVRLGGRCLACGAEVIPHLDRLNPAQGYLGWTFEMPAEVSEEAVRDIFDFVSADYALAMGAGAAMPPPEIAPEAEAPPVPAPAAAPPEVALASAPAQRVATGPAAATAGQSIRIELGKLDRVIDAVGELVIAQAMLAQRLGSCGVGASDELALLESLTRDIQDSAMAIRAQPISTVFNRVPRILRELAASTGKHVRLELSGEATELDKTVIERLGEPLTHLIRNSVDHGIETVEERIAAGKDPEGTLALSAEHRSGQVFIRISDDGRGIDRQKVLVKAVERGLVSAEAQLSPEEIDNLIFAPGFSTATTVTSVSGRGVGMDVVRQNVKDLGGRIAIESEPGRGTAMTLSLPLTLAIADGMIVEAGDEAIVVPLSHVIECLQAEPGQVQGMGHGAVVNLRGRYIPVVPLRVALGGANEADSTGVLIVVETQVAGPAALLVDQISDQRQFVIKSLDTNFRPVEGISGATILGDGRVAVILDVDATVARALNCGAVPDERRAA